MELRQNQKYALSFVIAIILLLISFCWQNSNFSYGDEQKIMEQSSLLRHYLFKNKQSDNSNSYLFINVAHDLELISQEDGLGNEVITDRGKLAQFFRILQQNPSAHNIVLSDIFLQGSSPNDSSLQASIDGLDRLVFPTHFDELGNIEKTVIDVPLGLADYSKATSGFFKFKINQSDSLKTIPQVLYESIEGKKLETNSILWPINNLIIDHQIRPFDFEHSDQFAKVDLSELLVLPEELVLDEFVKDKILLIGNFESDVHETIAGVSPGTLILLNVYLSLKDSNDLIKPLWLIFMRLMLSVFSYFLLFRTKKSIEKRRIRWIGPLLASATFFTMLSMLSHILFNQPIQILLLTLLCNALVFVMQLYENKWRPKHLLDWAKNKRDHFLKPIQS